MRHRARLSQGTTRGIDLEASRHSFALSFPDLKSGRAIIRAGERPFAFGWTGGKAPFHVTVTDSTGVALVNAMDIRHWQIVIASPLRNFHPGRYKVTLKDADGTERSGSFEAVADQHLTASNISDPEIAAASTIIEIAEQGPSTPNRRFDAYLALAPYYENNETIRDLMDLMALGQINFGGN